MHARRLIARRGPLTPQDFKATQAKLLAQASHLDEYVSRHKAASRQQAGATCWLVTQQQLEQEVADCEAALGEAPAPPPLQALLVPPQPPQQPLQHHHTDLHKTAAESGGSSSSILETDLHQELGDADIDAALAALPSNLVPGAVALAGAVGQLLMAARGIPLQPETVGEIQGHLAALQAEVATACQQLGALVQLLHRNARRLAASGAVPVVLGNRASGGPAAALQEVCRAHPLADPAVKQHLAEEAASLEAAHADRRQQRAAAYAAFLRGPSSSRSGSSSSSCCCSSAQDEQSAQPAAPLTQEASVKAAGGDYQSSCLSSNNSTGEELEIDSAELLCCGPEPGAQENSANCRSSDESASLQGTAVPGALPTPRLLLGSSNSTGGTGSCQLGEWSEEEQEAFARIKQDCLAKCGGSAGGQAAALERMRSRLPGKSVEQLRAYWQWQVEAGRLRSAVVQLDRGWEEEVRAFLQAAEAVLGESTAEALQGAEAAAAVLEWEIEAVERAQALGEQHASRAEGEAQRAQQRLAELAQQAGQREVQRAQQGRYRARLASLVQQYRQEQQAKREREEAEAAAAEARRTQEAAEEAQRGKHRVQLRRQLQEERAGARAAAAQEREREAAARAAALDRLRAQVAPAVERDPQRAMASTASTRAVGGKQRGRAFRQMFGFTTDQLLKDQRFKLLEALQSLNLHAAEYSKQVLARARPAKPARPDTLTTLQMLGLA